MRRERRRGSRERQTRILVRSLLVFASTEIVDICEGFVGINDYVVGVTDSRVCKILSKACLKNRENGVIGRMDCRRRRGRD